jgi:hypothetical protein
MNEHLETLAELVDEWEARKIVRYEFYARLLPCITAENVDVVMRQKLPKGVRMHFFRQVVLSLDQNEKSSSSTDNEKSPFDIVLEWARANMDFARSVAFPLSSDPTEIEELRRVLSEHLITHGDFDRIITKILSNGEEVRNKLEQFSPGLQRNFLRTWAKHIHWRVERGAVDLPDEVVREVRAWYAEQAQSSNPAGSD